MSRKIVIMLLFTAIMGFAAEMSDTAKVDVKTTEKQLSSEEKVLAGVLLMNDSYNLTITQKHEYYLALLKETKVTHEQFKRYLESAKKSSKEWEKSLKRLNDVFE